MAPNQLDSFQRWKDAQKVLDDAIQRYMERTTELGVDISNLVHGHQPYDLDSLRATVSEAHKDAHSMPLRTEKLQKAAEILKTIRDASSLLVPINRLPPELLLRIFCLSIQEKENSCILYGVSMSASSPRRHYDTQTLLALTRVCARWRTIVIGNPSFWAHIDLSFGSLQKVISSCDRIGAWLERAHNVPLCLWVDGHDTISEQGRAMITNRLQPRLGDIGVLLLDDFGNLYRLLDFILSLTGGRPGSVHTLAVRLYQTQWPRMLNSTDNALSQQHVDSFLKSILVLRLYGGYFGWGSSVYHDLVVLQLGGLHERESPTLWEMLDVLSACPQLHTLQLQEMSILASQLASRQPVLLSALNRLELLGVDPNSLRRLLPMINTQSQQLGVRILIWEFPAPDCDISNSAVHAFLVRSNVSRLCISAFANGARIAEYLSVVPNLNILIILCNPQEGDNILAALMRSSESSTKCTPRCPQLHTLYLINGRFRSTSIKQMVKNQPLIKKLVFQSCTFDSSEQELLSGLKPFVNDVYCERSGTKSYAYWDYCFI